MQKPQLAALIGAIILLSDSCVLLAQQSTTDALNAQDSSLQSSVDSQKRIDALDDTTRDLLVDSTEVLLGIRAASQIAGVVTLAEAQRL